MHRLWFCNNLPSVDCPRARSSCPRLRLQTFRLCSSTGWALPRGGGGGPSSHPGLGGLQPYSAAASPGTDPRLRGHVGAQWVARPTARHPCCPPPAVLAGQGLLPTTWCIFTHMLHCPVGLPVRSTGSRRKLSRISRWREQSVKPRAGSILSWEASITPQVTRL